MADKQIYRFPNEIDTIEITSMGAKIIVRPHDEEGIYVEYDNPKDTPEFCAVLNGKTLTLKELLSFSIIGNKPAEDYTISVFLPAVCYNRIKINTTSGGADVENINAENFELNTASGEINVNSYFDNIKVTSASGSINLSNPTENTAKSLSTRAVSGSASINGYRAEKFSVHSVSGRTCYNGACGAGEISVTSGTVEVNYAEWAGDLNISAISGSVNVSLPADSGFDVSFSGISGMLKTDIGNAKGSFMNLGKGTSGEFGGENKHKLNVSLTSGVVTVAQQ